MSSCNPVQIPIVPVTQLVKDSNGTRVDDTLFKQVVGSLMYLTTTRPYIMFVVSLISRFMGAPTEMHFLAAKRVLRYIKGTSDYGLSYKKGSVDCLVEYSDSGYGGDLEDRKSTSGYAFIYGSAPIAWSSKKQPIVTLSTTEAEFIAAAHCACQVVWMRRLLSELQCSQTDATHIMCDNSSTIKLSKNPIMHRRSKHIDIRYHFLRGLVKEKVIELEHCQSQEQVADIFTKPLKFDLFVKLLGQLGVCSKININ
ncbi:secreted RxLR effector protein 161-like [Tripterygium wilfordii]|uniref:secreted RxLR effector protein 161-like n=1 Tax=Tripterygium wilfordii TaxID=458696 RepID=UPI0018F853F1|nr:secreted RxLR effector protein 161-like [Tripterygium wilfordii]